MDKVVFSISKTDQNNYVIENKMDNTSYKFQEFSDIIDAFSGTNSPKFTGHEQGQVTPSSPENTIHVYKRVMQEDQTQNLPKYFWSKSYDNKVDPFEKFSVMEVLLHARKNMTDW